MLPKLTSPRPSAVGTGDGEQPVLAEWKAAVNEEAAMRKRIAKLQRELQRKQQAAKEERDLWARLRQPRPARPARPPAVAVVAPSSPSLPRSHSCCSLPAPSPAAPRSQPRALPVRAGAPAVRVRGAAARGSCGPRLLGRLLTTRPPSDHEWAAPAPGPASPCAAHTPVPPTLPKRHNLASSI